LAALAWSCGSAAPPPNAATEAPRSDAPVVTAQPGAWFDVHGNLTVVGPGRRLRLILSAPISPCAPAFETSGPAAEVVTAASIPFHVLSDACRDAHPTILLAEESQTASPAELERSYHEVAHCAGTDFGLLDGWIPRLIADADPCPLALGQGFRLPRTDELSGLSVDDRKALAGAWFDTEDRSAFGGLLLYARSPDRGLTLVTLSPNAAEAPPALDDTKRDQPFFGAALRCVSDSPNRVSSRATWPVLPHAAQCLREQRKAQGLLTTSRREATLPELQQLKLWLEKAERAPASARTAAQLQELSALLASPAIERAAREARDERALTERYAELAEGLDDPSASAAERERRRAEFDSLRKRLGGQIVQSAEGAGSARRTLAALLPRLTQLLEAAATAKPSKKRPSLDYRPALARVRDLARTSPP
jgi:hypothetical protein